MKNYWIDRGVKKINMDACCEIAARIWCDKEFEHVVMDGEACEQIAYILFRVAKKQNKVMTQLASD